MESVANGPCVLVQWMGRRGQGFVRNSMRGVALMWGCRNLELVRVGLG